MLLFSAGVGVWYAIKDRKKTDTQEFLMGGRSLSVFPVAMSVLASFMSAITLLGTPAEVYRFGTQYIIINIAFCLVVPVTAYLYLPVFYNLGVTSAYEVISLPGIYNGMESAARRLFYSDRGGHKKDIIIS
ncbi:sodium-coupled monocarboxylate transporter 2 [Trichonephila inaurata madagascariensis]|uniref:Sodium-coupled monocarboxylate transporter 2 n=1 Tax=Trichonephila inaurata madagascariensis TaxID=2747483 RepID=A0A8X6YEW9_9ARAC|nr:sodium-coupled monocarboxylate transporter 2 [Trichonephila inaurata madagascariensis]